MHQVNNAFEYCTVIACTVIATNKWGILSNRSLKDL